MSIEKQKPASCQTAVSRGRCYGRTHEMVLEIKKALEERGECGVGLMKDATDTLKRLKELGVNARVEPTYRTMPPMIKRNELGEPVDLMLNEKVQVGVVFYLC
jgi:hypothetical protein